MRPSLLIVLLSIPTLVSSQQPIVWQRPNGPYGGVIYSIVENPDGWLFAATEGDGIFRSKDNGATWVEVNNGLTNPFVFTLAVSRTGILYAGTESGVYRSLDSSNNWTPMNTGLDNVFARSLTIARNGYLLTGTAGSGIFRTTEAVASPELSPEDIPNAFLLHQNFPNPFNSTTAIQFQVPQQEVVTLRVFDLLGRELATLVSQAFPVGTHQVLWDASGFPSGVYVYRLEAGTFKASKRAVLLK